MRFKDVVILLAPVVIVIVALALVPAVLLPATPPLSPAPTVPPAASPGAASSPVASAVASPQAQTAQNPGNAPAPAQAVQPASGQPATTSTGGKGNIDHGKQLFTAKGCAGCHTIADIPGAVGKVGPELTHIGTVAATRKPGMDAEAYIRESIEQPAAFIAPGFTNDMPTGLASGSDEDDLVAMLLAHK